MIKQAIEPACASANSAIATVALIGDSTMYQSGNRMQIAMDSAFGANRVAVTNLGVSGTNSSEAPKRVKATVIVANYGINDLAGQMPISDYTANMKAIGATLVETQNPVTISSGLPLSADAYVAAAKGLGLRVADTYTYVLAQDNWRSLLVDGVHPSTTLQNMIAINVTVPAVEAQLIPLLCK